MICRQLWRTLLAYRPRQRDDRRMMPRIRLVVLAATLIGPALLPCVSAGQSFPLDSTRGLQPHDVTVEAVEYKGRKAVRVMPTAASDEAWAAGKGGEGGGIVVIPATSFHNGTIEVDVVGKPRAGAPAEARGFVGVAFRVAADASKYEAIYVRPTNARADDQLRRNHSTQYISFPDFLWLTLRNETPGKYESYVDLVPGEWTRLKIEFSGGKARLYVNDAPHPVLLVNDLKTWGQHRGGRLVDRGRDRGLLQQSAHVRLNREAPTWPLGTAAYL
jgi:hypothetical protein